MEKYLTFEPIGKGKYAVLAGAKRKRVGTVAPNNKYIRADVEYLNAIRTFALSQTGAIPMEEA